MKKLIAFMVLAPPLFGAVVFGWILVRGPRMTVQHHIREFQMVLPGPAQGSVSVKPVTTSVTVKQGVMEGPRATTALLAQGRVYYDYYCLFCHGSAGAGDGPVGNSYVPRPADLRRPSVEAYPDGELLRRMLTGTGHEPVLERVVPQRHRWPLLLYLRALGAPH
ncbi:cytochrome C [Geomonas terrae]|uniref:Cytochrome C n=1 Tax=Geomonas terrae TaxID=2562681 RepID=A0A4V3P099_9BACT|nr:cytochrome C [Geomonas terrae]TGU74732.1 cytochrome C [Geomonas terrae]